jgi:ABC-type multidrug transport system ATPase subunit
MLSKIVQLLVDQSRKGKTIVATIHQPSSSTFKLFDKLLLLMDGHTIYQGNAKDAADYFHTLNFTAPKYSNPADYFLKEFYVPFKRTDKDNDKIDTLVKGYNDKLLLSIMNENETVNNEELSKAILSKNDKSANIWIELGTLIARTFKNLVRDPVLPRIRFVQTLVMGKFLNNY